MSAEGQTQSLNGAGEAFEWDVFISYGRADKAALARRIADALRAKGLKVWLDDDTLHAGDFLPTEIADAIGKSRAVAFVISHAFLNSGWAKLEMNLAVTRSANGNWQNRVIPLLSDVDEPPPFLLQSSLWVDFKDESRFDENIDELVRGILSGGGGGPSSEKERGEEERRLLSRLAFLWFFPEGMLDKFYDRLISERGCAGEAASAERLGLVRAVETDGLLLKGAAPEALNELGGFVTDKAAAADELMAAVEGWIEEESPFEFVMDTGVGVGRALLVRDVILLARHLPDEGEEAERKREKACELARELLPRIVGEGLLRIGLEVSVGLRAVSGIQLPTDNLMHARVLLRAGDASQAADIFDIYKGDNLFDDFGLGGAERFACALEWAMSLKNARRARERHREIVDAYGKMLHLIDAMRADGDDPDELMRREAELRNNRATQIAAFGSDDEWPVAQEDFATASDMYRLIGDDERLIAASANAVAHTLDRLDRLGKKAAPEELGELLRSLEGLTDYADKSEAGEDLFFFLYQKARVLKRLYPEEPQKAREVYESAAMVADSAGLGHRAAVARRWVFILRERADDISESDYLEGLRACAATLDRYKDAWSYNALVENYLDLARVLRRRQNKEEAWAVALKAFELDAQRSAWKKSESTQARLKEVLRLLNGLNVSVELREAFISQNKSFLKDLLGIPAYKPVNWEQVAQRSGQQKGADGNAIH